MAKEKAIQMQFRFTPVQHQWLANERERTGDSVNAIVRRMIQDRVDAESKNA